eukprot:TRINITY_DN23630_c0_g1_i1.p1 TRINITY_DN23630_c0_g1~~TRINITY_DN23630_c0_g1_i1.p1  ORF type:complete len:1018 (+),score=167.07 TRINITY_DN23630_c0_g1_i1:166-3219(+)
MNSAMDNAVELFGYNRKGYFFDAKMRQEREYWEQDVRIKKFLLYREDIRDLTNLTTAKMDSYLLVALLELGCCIIMLVEGVLHGTKQFRIPSWLCWLYVVSLADAVLYLFLSAWFAVHASVAAHSFSVRLLTQFVRLPLPSKGQLDAARGYAADFEGTGVTGLLRIPVVQQQVERLSSATTARNAGEDDSGAMGLQALAAQSGSATAALKHVKLYRALQSNWQAHDAYARTCLALGTYSFVYAFAYYCIGLLVIEHANPQAAFACTLMLLTVVWLILRLDLYFDRSLFLFGSGLLCLGPLLTFVATTLWRSSYNFAVRNAYAVLVPIIFGLHAALIMIVAYVARAEQVADRSVALPTRFRTVLYLDVFAWLGESTNGAASPAQSVDGDQHGPRSPRETARLHGRLPPQLRASLMADCVQLADRVERELKAWQSGIVAANVRGVLDVVPKVMKLRSEFLPWQEKLQSLVATPVSGGSPDGSHAGPSECAQRIQETEDQPWLRLVWSSAPQRDLNVDMGLVAPDFAAAAAVAAAGQVPPAPQAMETFSVEFYVHPVTGESRREPPAGAEVSDLTVLAGHVATLQRSIQALGHKQSRFAALSQNIRRRRDDLIARASTSFRSGGSFGNANFTTASGSFGNSPQESGASRSFFHGLTPPSNSSGSYNYASAVSNAVELRTPLCSPPVRSLHSSPIHSPARSPAQSPELAPRPAPANVEGMELSSPAQETRFGGAEAVDETVVAGSGNFAHSEAAAQTFHPRQDGFRESRKPPGQVPWLIFRNASAVIVAVWLLGVLNYTIIEPIQMFISNSPVSPYDGRPPVAVLHAAPGELPQTSTAAVHPLASAGMPWSGTIAIACREGSSSAGSLLMLERFAVYELSLDPGAIAFSGDPNGGAVVVQSPLRRQDDIDGCLEAAPSFRAAGLSSLRIICSAGGDCDAVVLLNQRGGRLRCRIPRSGARPLAPALLPAPLLPGANLATSACRVGGHVYALGRAAAGGASSLWRFDADDWDRKVAANGFLQ